MDGSDYHMTKFAAAMLGLVIVATPATLLSQRASDRLTNAKALQCVFSTLTTGDWKAGAASAETKPVNIKIGFDEIDADDGTARVIGAFGPSEIVVRQSGGVLHFLQSFREGPLYVTTIFPYESRPGLLRAVHTRHEFTEVSLPGFTSRPEQYVGDCEVTK